MERIWIIAGGAALFLLLILSVVISVWKGQAEFPSDSPEATVQQYLRALVDRDFDTAYSLWSPEIKERCSVVDFVDVSDWDTDRIADARVGLRDTRDIGDIARVEISSTYSRSGGIYSPFEYGYDYTWIYMLQQYDGRWHIVRHSYPWIGCISKSSKSDELERADSVLAFVSDSIVRR